VEVHQSQALSVNAMMDRVDVVSGCHESYSVQDSEHVMQSWVICAVMSHLG